MIGTNGAKWKGMSDEQKKEIRTGGEVTDRERAKDAMEKNWKDVKRSNDRENKIADEMIRVQIQAASIFIGLQAAFLRHFEQLTRDLMLFSIIFLALSIIFGVIGFYLKEKFWIVKAAKYQLIAQEWRDVWLGRSVVEHAEKQSKAITENKLRSSSSRWPIRAQAGFFLLATIASLVVLVNEYLT